MILVKDDLHGIVALMKIAKETLRSVSQNITICSIYKDTCVVYGSYWILWYVGSNFSRDWSW